MVKRYELNESQWRRRRIAELLPGKAGDPGRKRPIPYDFEIYKARNRIERCFNKLKHFRRIATRYDRRAVHCKVFIYLVCAMPWMR